MPIQPSGSGAFRVEEPMRGQGARQRQPAFPRPVVAIPVPIFKPARVISKGLRGEGQSSPKKQ